MKGLIATILLLCLALAGAVSGAEQATNNSTGCVGCDSDSANVTENQTETHIFIQEASSGSFVNDSTGNYTLTLNDVVPYTIFFADRPARDVGFAPMDKFLKGFNFGASNPPNAALILSEENETSDMVIVELTNPQYNNTTQTVIYKARQLKEYSFESGWLQDQIGKVDPSIPEKFGRAILVIDDCPCVIVTSGCDSGCKNSCWEWKILSCKGCGGCCGHWDCDWIDKQKTEEPNRGRVRGPLKSAS
jgi:hypothetical protein